MDEGIIEGGEDSADAKDESACLLVNRDCFHDGDRKGMELVTFSDLRT